MMTKIELDNDQYVRVYQAWKSDVDDEGYDYPFLEFWARRRWNATVYSNRIWYFKEPELAVQFKLTYSG